MNKALAILGGILGAGALAAGVVYLARRPANGQQPLPARPLPTQAIVPGPPPPQGYRPAGSTAQDVAQWAQAGTDVYNLWTTIFSSKDTGAVTGRSDGSDPFLT